VPKALVTGASGFVGTSLVAALVSRGYSVRAACRRAGQAPHGAEEHIVGDLAEADWRRAVEGVDHVFHLAARVHVMKSTRSDDALYASTNVDATRRLVSASITSGVQRLTFTSTVKVHGESAGPSAIRETDPPRPTDAYSRSKWAAEEAIREICAGTTLSYTIFRPPLVYGPGVKANLFALFRAVDRGFPLPVRNVRNRRSLLFVGNLVSALIESATNDLFANREFLVSDDHDVSTPQLVQSIAAALGRPPRMFSVPPAVLRFAGTLVRRRAAVDRLTGSLAVDPAAIRALGWVPPFAFDEGIASTAKWYRSQVP
jgi:nucleoside-diphosphate-sugar epimerase